MHFDLPELIRSVGYIGVWAITFAESGLLVGFFLPGDSLLFTAGFLAFQGFLNIWLLIIGAFVCAVVGDNVGYATGNRFGRRLFQKEDSWLFHKKHIVTAQKFYEKYGKKTIILARFMPIVRTFAPIVASIGSMHYRTFLTYNLSWRIYLDLWCYATRLFSRTLNSRCRQVLITDYCADYRCFYRTLDSAPLPRK